MRMRNPLCSVLLLLSLIGCNVVIAQPINNDFDVRVAHATANALVQYFLPFLADEIKSQSIAPQSIEGVLDLEIGTIFVRSFGMDLSLSFDAIQQSIGVDVQALNVSLWPFRMAVGKQWTDTLGLTCNMLVTSAFTNWAFQFTFQPLIDGDCAVSLVVDESSIVITTGDMHLSMEYASDFCNNLIESATVALDLENAIKQEIVNKMPQIITDDLQNAINEALQSVHYIESLNVAMCYDHVFVNNGTLQVVGDFMTIDDASLLPSATNIDDVSTYKMAANVEAFNMNTFSAKNETDKDLLVILFVLAFFVFLLIAFGLTYWVCHCVYHRKFTEIQHQYSNQAPSDNDEESINAGDTQPINKQ